MADFMSTKLNLGVSRLLFRPHFCAVSGCAPRRDQHWSQQLSKAGWVDVIPSLTVPKRLERQRKITLLSLLQMGLEVLSPSAHRTQSNVPFPTPGSSALEAQHASHHQFYAPVYRWEIGDFSTSIIIQANSHNASSLGYLYLFYLICFFGILTQTAWAELGQTWE